MGISNPYQEGSKRSFERKGGADEKRKLTEREGQVVFFEKPPLNPTGGKALSAKGGSGELRKTGPQGFFSSPIKRSGKEYSFFQRVPQKGPQIGRTSNIWGPALPCLGGKKRRKIVPLSGRRDRVLNGFKGPSRKQALQEGLFLVVGENG